MDPFEIPGYDFEYVHLVVGVGLGSFSVLALLAYVAIGGMARRVSTLIPHPVLRVTLFGALIGLIAWALPLTAAGGNSQLAYATENVGAISVGPLVAVLLAKMVADHLARLLALAGRCIRGAGLGRPSSPLG